MSERGKSCTNHGWFAHMKDGHPTVRFTRMPLFCEIETLRSRVAELEARVDEARKLITTYRHQTPLGHQPHMIAEIVDKWLKEQSGNE